MWRRLAEEVVDVRVVDYISDSLLRFRLLVGWPGIGHGECE